MVFACAFEKGRLPLAYVFSRDAEGQQVFQQKLQNLRVLKQAGVRVSTKMPREIVFICGSLLITALPERASLATPKM